MPNTIHYSPEALADMDETYEYIRSFFFFGIDTSFCYVDCHVATLLAMAWKGPFDKLRDPGVFTCSTNYSNAQQTLPAL